MKNGSIMDKWNEIIRKITFDVTQKYIDFIYLELKFILHVFRLMFY